MKKAIALILLLALTVVFAACGEDAVSSSSAPDISPEVTEAPEATEAPESTEEPEVTEAPEATAAPTATKAPTATVAPTVTAAPTATKAPEPTKEPAIKTYTAYVEDSSGEVPNVWEIKGVFAEGTYQPQNGFPLPLRVFYVTEENAATLLRDLYPGDYAYRGAFYVDDSGNPCGDYNAMKPYGNFEQYIKDEEPCIRQGGYYKNLPKGSWYFGSVRFSDGFIVVVGDREAAQNGTVPVK